MTLRSSRRVSIWVALAWLCLAGASPAHADTRVLAALLRVPGIELKQLDARIDHTSDGQLQLTLTADQADVPVLGWRRVGVKLQGHLRRLRANLWSCRGNIVLDGAPGGLLKRQQPFVLTIDTGANTLELDLGPVPLPMVSIAMPLDQLSHVQTRLFHLPLSWLQGPLQKALKGRLTAGVVDGTVASDFDASGVQGSALLDVTGAGFDGGAVATRRLDFKGRVNFRSDGKGGTADVSGKVHDGELLVDRLFARLPSRPAQLAFNLSARSGALRLRQLRYADNGTLSLEGGLSIARNGTIGDVSLGRFSAQLPAAYRRYGRTWLNTLGLRDLTTAGSLSGALSMTSGHWRLLRVKARNLHASDADGRFRVDGLNGSIDWRASGTHAETGLSWKGLDVHHIVLGAGATRWRSQGGLLQLQAPATLDLLGGKLRIERLAWRPSSGSDRLADLSAAVTGVDMARLSRKLGWPVIRGTLGGAVTGLRHAGGRVQLEGGLNVHALSGFVDATHLSFSHLFGDAPEVGADLDLAQLDLKAMTRLLHFGQITGRLQGRVAKLRLVDGKPVQFDAQLLAYSGGHVSRRAVNNLTALTGGSPTGGLKGAVLSLFSTYRYARIGLNSSLRNGACQLAGLEPLDDGYLVVDGAGLPHLRVIGHQKKLPWPTLVSRWHTATRGGG